MTTLDVRSHAFNVGIAMDYSPTMALWLCHLAHWAEKNLATEKNLRDGLAWSYDTLESLSDYFPYFSKSQIETMVNNSIKEGLVVKGNYNQTKYDRTSWYALSPKAYAYFPHLLSDKYTNRLFLSISENSEMDLAEFRNRFPGNRTTIPDTDPDTDPTTTTTEEPPKPKEQPSKIEPLKSSSIILSETLDQEFIKLKEQHLPNDERTPEEFLKQCKFHIDTGNKKYTNQEKIGGLKRIIKKGCFETPKAYPRPKENSTGESDLVLYSRYVGDIKCQIDLKLLPEDTKIPTFEEWNSKRV